MNELTVEQIHEACAARLAAVRRGKVALAEAVRDCCRDLPLGEVLSVAEHTLEWIEAYCAVWGGYDWQRQDRHTQRVLVLNGRLLPQPRFVVTKPDWADSNFHRDGDWVGPEGGWYSVAAERQYDRLCAKYGECDSYIEKPTALRVCNAVELSKAAKALPAALAAWLDRNDAELENVAGALPAETEPLRLQSTTMHTSN